MIYVKVVGKNFEDEKEFIQERIVIKISGAKYIKDAGSSDFIYIEEPKKKK
jgi:hypothetical protein